MYAQQVRANNLANADTVGFKSLMEHSEHMRLQGSGFESSVTARTNSALTNFREGDSVTTGKALDVAILGSLKAKAPSLSCWLPPQSYLL